MANHKRHSDPTLSARPSNSPWSLRTDTVPRRPRSSPPSPAQDWDSADEASSPPTPATTTTITTTRSAKSPHLTAELEYWRQKAFFLREEYQHLLTFVHMLGHITALDRGVEAALQSVRVAAVENLISALVFMENEVVEFPPSVRARRGVESALRVWNGLQLEILDFVFEKFYRKHSSLMGLAAGKN